MTDEKMTLFELIQKADSTDFLKELAATALQRLMEFQVDDLCGAGRHERTGDRANYRNGHRPRTLETRLYFGAWRREGQESPCFPTLSGDAAFGDAGRFAIDDCFGTAPGLFGPRHRERADAAPGVRSSL